MQSGEIINAAVAILARIGLVAGMLSIALLATARRNPIDPLGEAWGEWPNLPEGFSPHGEFSRRGSGQMAVEAGTHDTRSVRTSERERK